MLIDTRTIDDQPPTAPPENPADDLICPVTGEVVDETDADALIDCLDRIQKRAREIYAAKELVVLALACMTEGDAKTRRVEGRRRKAKITMPSDSWDQSILKEVWNAYPDHRDRFLRLGTVAVNLREWKKLQNTTAPKDVDQIKKMLDRANRGATGNPSVRIEQ